MWAALCMTGLIAALPPPEAPRLQGGVELLAEVLPSGPAGAQVIDGFFELTPLFDWTQGDAWQLTLAPTLRLRVVDPPPAQRGGDYLEVLRRQDWDERSDFGQLLRLLRAGGPESRVRLTAGAFDGWTLGSGHLVNRYGNQANLNYHPAGADLSADLAPLRLEAFASDLLAPRLFALDVGADISALVPRAQGAQVSLSFARDFGRTGGGEPPITLAELDLQVSLRRGARDQALVYVGAGGRFDRFNRGAGGLVGASIDTRAGPWQLGGRLELRLHGGGFRQGLFNGAYELSRYAATGLTQGPLADERLPTGLSTYGEVAATTGGTLRFTASAAAEAFFFGRTDLDLAATLWSWAVPLSLSGRLIAVGLGQVSRTDARLEARYRFQPGLYAAVHVGTVFLPQEDKTLLRGVDAGAGIGADFGT